MAVEEVVDAGERRGSKAQPGGIALEERSSEPTAEGWTHDAVVLLAQIAHVTSRTRLATAVLPIWSRTPAAIAMSGRCSRAPACRSSERM